MLTHVDSVCYQLTKIKKEIAGGEWAKEIKKIEKKYCILKYTYSLFFNPFFIDGQSMGTVPLNRVAIEMLTSSISLPRGLSFLLRAQKYLRHKSHECG